MHINKHVLDDQNAYETKCNVKIYFCYQILLQKLKVKLSTNDRCGV